MSSYFYISAVILTVVGTLYWGSGSFSQGFYERITQSLVFGIAGALFGSIIMGLITATLFFLHFLPRVQPYLFIIGGFELGMIIGLALGIAGRVDARSGTSIKKNSILFSIGLFSVALFMIYALFQNHQSSSQYMVLFLLIYGCIAGSIIDLHYVPWNLIVIGLIVFYIIILSCSKLISFNGISVDKLTSQYVVLCCFEVFPFLMTYTFCNRSKISASCDIPSWSTFIWRYAVGLMVTFLLPRISIDVLGDQNFVIFSITIGITISMLHTDAKALIRQTRIPRTRFRDQERSIVRWSIIRKRFIRSAFVAFLYVALFYSSVEYMQLLSFPTVLLQQHSIQLWVSVILQIACFWGVMFAIVIGVIYSTGYIITDMARRVPKRRLEQFGIICTVFGAIIGAVPSLVKM